MSDDSPLRLQEIDPHGRPVRRGVFRRVLGWLGRHPILVLMMVVVLVPLGLGLHWWFLPNRPTLDAGKVESVTVSLRKYPDQPSFGPGYQQDEVLVTTADPAVIQPLLDVFRTARRAEEHKCGSSGTITVRRKDGTVEELSILPGHDEPYYEYRMGSRINRVDREPFLAALRALGIERIKTAPP